MQTKLRSDAFLCEAMEACGDAVYRLALCRMGSRADELRTVIHLHYVEGYRTEEIAPLVGCRPATVRTRLHRARKQLKLDLEGMDDEEEQPERMGADEKHKSAGGAEAAYPGGRA